MRLLPMLGFTKQNAIVTCLVVSCSGQYAAFGSDINNNNNVVGDENKRAMVAVVDISLEVIKEPRFGYGLPVDVMKKIFIEASKPGEDTVGADPRGMRKVSKHWHHSTRYLIPDAGPATADRFGVPYLNPSFDNFMEDCMRLFMEGLVSRGLVIYKQGQPEERVIFFSEDGTANISDCGGQDEHQVYTLNEARFGEVRRRNEYRVVTFIAPFHKAMHLLPADAVSKGKVSDLVVIWRWGNYGNIETNEPDMEKTDYLIISPALVGGMNMFENWQKSVGRVAAVGRCGECGGCFHVRLCTKLAVNDVRPRKKPRA